MSDLPLKENPPLSHVSRPLGPEVFELWFDSRANDDRDWLTPNRLLKYYPYGRTCSAAASAFVAAVSVF